MNKEKMIQGKNRSASQVIYTVGELGIRREFAPGETKKIKVGGTVTLAEGDYIVSGCYRDGESFINFDSTQDLTIEPEANSINGIENQKEVKSVELYSIAGARIANQHKGIAIRKTTFTDGTVKTEKTINK